MEQSNQGDKDKFFLPRATYHGQVKPKNLVFNANLQEFSHKISNIIALETSGKLSPEDACSKIKALWKQLKRSKKELGIGNSPPEST